jgi:hypothetical protein
MEVSFKGAIEPISMPLLAKAFGWPEFSGTMPPAFPACASRTTCSPSTAMSSHRCSVADRRQQHTPAGSARNFPQFFADVRARDLDLELVTRTFEVGSITGRLEVDVLGLELFAWTPQAFDARLATPTGDKSRHRISARAVSSLSNVGGGGGGVVQALQSGVLRFFDDYSYDKLGIRCRLSREVCEMSGVEPAPTATTSSKARACRASTLLAARGASTGIPLMSSISTADFGGSTVD